MMSKWTTTWSNVVMYGTELVPNWYKMTIDFTFETDNQTLQNVALDRMKCLLRDILPNCILIDIANPKLHDLSDLVDSFIVTLPGEPNDLLYGAAILNKLSKIGEGNLTVYGVSISSNQNDDVDTEILYEDLAEFDELFTNNSINKLAGVNGWYNRSDAGASDIFVINDENKFEILQDIVPWHEIGLSWDPTKNEPFNGPVAEPDRNNTPGKKGWQPTIINGDKK